MDGMWGIEDFELDHLFFLEAVEDLGETGKAGANTPRLSDQEVADLFPPNPATRTDSAQNHSFPYTPQFSPGFFADPPSSGAVTPSTQAIVNSITAGSPIPLARDSEPPRIADTFSKAKHAPQPRHENSTVFPEKTAITNTTSTTSKKSTRKDTKSVTVPTANHQQPVFGTKGSLPTESTPPATKRATAQTAQAKSMETSKPAPEKRKRVPAGKLDLVSEDNSDDNSDSDDSEHNADDTNKVGAGNGAPGAPGKKRRVHNKQAADRYRKKKKQQFEFFKEEVERLTSECDEWKRKYEELRSELQLIKETIKPVTVSLGPKKAGVSKPQPPILEAAPSPSTYLPQSPMLTLAQVAAMTQDQDRLPQSAPLKVDGFSQSGSFGPSFTQPPSSNAGLVLATSSSSFGGQFANNWSYPMLDLQTMPPQLMGSSYLPNPNSLPNPAFSFNAGMRSSSTIL